jgi:hypothetical protein
MGRYCLLQLIVLAGLCQGGDASGAAAAPGRDSVPADNPFAVLFRPDPATELRRDLEGRMLTASIIMGLLALGIVVPTLLWCKRLSEGLARLQAAIPDADWRNRMADLTKELQSLHAQTDRLRQTWRADTTRLESVIRELESRMVELEQTGSRLGAVSRDIESLRGFQKQVEQVHARLQKAFNGALAETPLAMLPNEEPRQADT